MTDSSSPGQKWSEIDTTVPHSARIWNYWLGGKDDYPVDREVGDQFSAIFPDIIAVARASRARRRDGIPTSAPLSSGGLTPRVCH